MKSLWLILLFLPSILHSQIKIDKAGDGWDLKVDSAISIIKKYDSTKYELLLKVCDTIEFWNGPYSTNNGLKTIVVSTKDVNLNSLNNLAAVIVHESFHLHCAKMKFGFLPQKEENTCYKYEFSFLEMLPNVEIWLWRHTLEQIVKTE